MNLVKNGAVLLAALGAFALTSCGPQTKTLDKAQAREFLKDAAKEDEIKAMYVVENEALTWNCKVTGTGMKPGEKDGGIYGPVQFMIAYLADRTFVRDPTTMGDWLENFKDLVGDYTSRVHETDKPGHNSTVSYLDQEGFDEIMNWGETDTYKFTVSQNLLHIKFDRIETLPDKDETKVSFIQEIVVAKDGWVKYYTATLDNLKVDINYSMGGQTLIKANGIANGVVKCVTNVKLVDQK